VSYRRHKWIGVGGERDPELPTVCLRCYCERRPIDAHGPLCLGVPMRRPPRWLRP
jgi:hypothetical protein